MSPIPATVYQFLLSIGRWPNYIAIVPIVMVVVFSTRLFIEKSKRIRGKLEIALLHETVEIFSESETWRVENLEKYFPDEKAKSVFKTNIILSNIAHRAIGAADLASWGSLRIKY